MNARAIIVMGVSGCGKSTIGLMLAAQLGWRFADGDDFHPAANVAKMKSGTPLNDDDRWPWLDTLNDLLRDSNSSGKPLVLACSALKQRYRDRLARDVIDVRLVHLYGSFELISARVAARQHKYMPVSLLRSQFDSLEAPLDALTINIDQPPEQLVNALVRAVR
jgi:gluconokinase